MKYFLPLVTLPIGERFTHLANADKLMVGLSTLPAIQSTLSLIELIFFHENHEKITSVAP